MGDVLRVAVGWQGYAPSVVAEGRSAGCESRVDGGGKETLTDGGTRVYWLSPLALWRCSIEVGEAESGVKKEMEL